MTSRPLRPFLAPNFKGSGYFDEFIFGGKTRKPLLSVSTKYTLLYFVFYLPVAWALSLWLIFGFIHTPVHLIKAIIVGFFFYVTAYKFGEWWNWILFFSIYTFVGSLVSYIGFKPLLLGFQQAQKIVGFRPYNFPLKLGVDGLSEVFVLLTVFIFPFCILAAKSVYRRRIFIAYLFLMEALLLITFLSTSFIFFYVFFESLLLPMFILIGVWGARERKIKAAYYFFLYTLFLLFVLVYLYDQLGSTSIFLYAVTSLDEELQRPLWLASFIAFAVKMPMFPLHIWLPEAHVEAPTVGSMLLASLLLKLGGYGFLRLSITIFNKASATFFSLLAVCAVLGVIYGSLATVRQIDLKRCIAYSSVAHMCLVTLGIFSGNQTGIDGAIYLMVAHGVVSAALFFCVGVIYDQHHSRLLRYYGGLAAPMPILAAAFLLFSLANMGFPLTANFVGELLIFVALFNKSSFVLGLATTGVIWSAAYSVWLFNRVFFGTIKTTYIRYFADVTRLENWILGYWVVAMLLLGVTANGVLNLVGGTGVLSAVLVLKDSTSFSFCRRKFN